MKYFKDTFFGLILGFYLYFILIEMHYTVFIGKHAAMLKSVDGGYLSVNGGFDRLIGGGFGSVIAVVSAPLNHHSTESKPP